MGDNLTAPARGRRERMDLVEHIIRQVLTNSEALSNLLRFLAQHSIGQAGPPPKEYQIALDVFHRPEDFDPRADSTVRVHVARLRTKLAEYYSAAGAEDDQVIEIPKGAYRLVFRDRSPRAARPGPLSAAATTRTAPHGAQRRWFVAGIAAVLVFVALAAAVALRRRDPAAQSAVSAFWTTFNTGSKPLLIIFSNAHFFGRPETGLRYFDPSRDSRNDVFDLYTGVGEVLAAFELGRVFTGLHIQADIKRGQLLNWDDIRDRDLVFIGSPSENLALKELRIQHEFVFKVKDVEPRRGDLAIVNLHPRTGERATYLASSALPILEDYALIELLPGFTPSQFILVLAGTTTFGTQAAAEFLCRPDRLQQLFKRLNGADSLALSPFAGLLQVRISRGVPVESHLVAFRKLASR